MAIEHLNKSLDCEYINDVYNLIGGGSTLTKIKKLVSYVTTMDNSMNPIVAYPEFKTFKAVALLLNELYVKTNLNVFSSGSDACLRDVSVISMDIDTDNDEMSNINDNMQSVGEEPTLIIDITNPDFITALKNMVLSDFLLCLMIAPDCDH